MSTDRPPNRRFVHLDVPRGRYVVVEIPGTDPRLAVARGRRQFDDWRLGRQSRGMRCRVVFGVDNLDEKLAIWDFGLDDYVVEALKGDMLDAAGPDLDMAEIRFADRANDMLWFSCVIPSAANLGRFAMPLRSYRHRAADVRRIEIDHPHLNSEWLVDVSAGDYAALSAAAAAANRRMTSPVDSISSTPSTLLPAWKNSL